MFFRLHITIVIGTFSGKTLLARAVAHHTDCTFIRVSGSELVQKFIGEGSRMVRELFVMARYIFKRLLIFPNEMINGNVGNKGNTLLPSFSWTRSIPSALHVLNLVAVGILKFNVPCWNCWISSMVSKPPKISKWVVCTSCGWWVGLNFFVGVPIV